MHLTLNPDYETSTHAGCDGAFQVISLTDENDVDYAKSVGQGTHFWNLMQLKSAVARITSILESEIEISED